MCLLRKLWRPPPSSPFLSPPAANQMGMSVICQLRVRGCIVVRPSRPDILFETPNAVIRVESPRREEKQLPFKTGLRLINSFVANRTRWSGTCYGSFGALGLSGYGTKDSERQVVFGGNGRSNVIHGLLLVPSR